MRDQSGSSNATTPTHNKYWQQLSWWDDIAASLGVLSNEAEPLSHCGLLRRLLRRRCLQAVRLRIGGQLILVTLSGVLLAIQTDIVAPGPRSESVDACRCVGVDVCQSQQGTTKSLLGVWVNFRESCAAFLPLKSLK
jgi:hypothetical protein